MSAPRDLAHAASGASPSSDSMAIAMRLREVADGIRKQGASAIEARELEAAADVIAFLVESQAELLAALRSYLSNASVVRGLPHAARAARAAIAKAVA